MPLPSDFYDDDKLYLLRLCMLVEEAVAVSYGSKIHPCDGCEELIWVNETQEIPPLPDGMVANGSLSVCRNCAKDINEKSQLPAPTFLKQPGVTPEVEAQAREFFGLETP
jgi:hypothetical protein